jgi:WD repeat-containing protein 6
MHNHNVNFCCCLVSTMSHFSSRYNFLLLFPFDQDHNIHIRRHWVPTQDKKLLPQVLHLQFHGREVHSLCFIDPSSHSNFLNRSDLHVATGCEDGTVRLTG